MAQQGELMELGSPTHKRQVNTFTVAGTKFEIDSKFELIKPIGHGAYGVVISCKDLPTGQKVAIKKIPNAFEDIIDAKRVLREIKLLLHFKHDNLMSVTDLLRPISLQSFKDVYIVSPLMETDLHRIIYSRQDLTDDHVQYFIYQILRALKYMHSAKVLHRDLKPSNLLLNSNCDLKICDFGLARGLEESSDLTEYVVTRWYRAPEIMLSCQDYSIAVDVWSVGCIFAELLGRKPLFPGDDYIHQLQLISEVLGTPSEEDMHFIKSEKARRFMKNLPFRPKLPYAQLYPKANPLALDLLERMLKFDPDQRITVVDALKHKYMDSLHCPEDEPEAESQFNFDFDRHELTTASIRELIFREVISFHPEAAAELEEHHKAKKFKTESASVGSVMPADLDIWARRDSAPRKKTTSASPPNASPPAAAASPLDSPMNASPAQMGK